MNIKAKLAYPLWFFIILLSAKLIYIFIESGYNYDILNITTSKNFSKSALESLNNRGHIIASVGFTLFIMPFIYFLAKKSSQKLTILFLGAFSIVTFIAFYFLLNIFVDTIVEKNKDKRYEAYYTNLVKYGMLNDIIYYNSFIDSNKLNNLDINSKIAITNIVLLLYADKKLIEKFRVKGEDKVIELVLNKYNKDEFQKKYLQFKKFAKKVENWWIEFNNKKEKLQKALEKLNSKQEKQEAYNKMIKKLKNRYLDYKKNIANYDYMLKEKLSLKNLRAIKQDLDNFFRYKNYKKAKNIYKAKMIENFGHYIEPKEWLDKQGRVTYNSIENVIKKEALKSLKEQLHGLKANLEPKEFFNNIYVKAMVARELKIYGILIPKDFDYSYNSFLKYYNFMANKKGKELIDNFYTKIKEKIGENDLKLNMSWEDFINSKFVANKLKDAGVKEIKIYQKILISKELNNFRDTLYLPQAYKVARKKLIYEKEDFYKNKKVAKYGNEAIKLLYIPPLALFLSILAMILNIITVVAMLLKLIGLNKIVYKSLILVLTILVLCMPFKLENKIDSKIILESKNKFLLNSFKWSSLWIEKNYNLHLF